MASRTFVRHVLGSPAPAAVFSAALASMAACGGGGSSGGSVDFIPGTATLPDCSEPSAIDLDGTAWADNGTVTIVSGNCDGAGQGDSFDSCGLTWEFTQTGNDVEIIVDDEYRIEGRFCGDELHLRGGFWLPVQDEGQCTYEEDSAEEVGILAGGNVLTYDEAGDFGEQLGGILSIASTCDAEYDVFFLRID
jgi:hypothetical protein